MAVSEAAATGRDLLNSAESALEEIVLEKRQPTDEEQAFFASVGWGKAQVATERRRLSTRLALEKRAGTDKQRKAARKAADDARSEADEKLPVLESEIAELERQRAEIVQQRDESEARASAMEEAHRELQSAKLLPRHLQKAVSEARAEARHKYEPVELRGRVIDARFAAAQEGETSWPREMFKRVLSYAQRVVPEAVNEITNRSDEDDTAGNELIDYKLKPAIWNKHVAEQVEALPGLERQLEAAEAKLTSEVQKAEQRVRSGD